MLFSDDALNSYDSSRAAIYDLVIALNSSLTGLQAIVKETDSSFTRIDLSIFNAQPRASIRFTRRTISSVGLVQLQRQGA